MYDCKDCGAPLGTTHKAGCPQLRGLSVSRAGDGSVGFNDGFQKGYQRGMDDYADDRSDNPDVLRMQALDEHKACFGYNVELGAWGMEYESPWFPTLRELADWLITQNMD